MISVNGYAVAELVIGLGPYTEPQSLVELELVGRGGWWRKQKRHLWWLPGNGLLSITDAESHVLLYSTARHPNLKATGSNNMLGSWGAGHEIYALAVGVLEDRTPVQVLVERLMELEYLPLM